MPFWVTIREIGQPPNSLAGQPHPPALCECEYQNMPCTAVNPFADSDRKRRRRAVTFSEPRRHAPWPATTTYTPVEYLNTSARQAQSWIELTGNGLSHRAIHQGNRNSLTFAPARVHFRGL